MIKFLSSVLKPRVLAVLFSTLLGLISLEVGLRFFGPFERAGKSPDNILWQPDEEIGFAPAVDLDAILSSNEWLNEVRTNEFGFRISNASSPSVDSSLDTIMFLGDSQTMATQVAAESTYVSIIGRELARKGHPMRVINAGCNGFNTVQEYLFFKKLYDHGFRPKVVVVFAVNNDLFEDVPGLPYGRYYLDSEGYVVRTSPDPQLLAQLRRAKEMPPPQANGWLVQSALLRHLRYYYRTIRNPHDVAGWVKDIYLRDDVDPSPKERWAVATAAIRSLNRLVSSYGGMVIVAVNPDPVEWSDEYYGRLNSLIPELAGKIDRLKIQKGYRRVAEKVGVEFIDMLKDFPAISVREFRFAMDPHANISGHRIIASQMLKGFERLGWFK